MLLKNCFQPIVTCMVNLSYGMSEKQAGTLPTTNKLPSVSNDRYLTSNSCQQLGCGSLLTSIMHIVCYRASPKWGEIVLDRAHLRFNHS